MIKNDVRRDVGAGAKPVTSGFKVDISRGQRIGRVSSEWFSRPDDERYLSLSALHDAVRTRAERATARTVETKSLRVEARTNDVSRLSLAIPGCPDLVAPTHWSFGQLCGLGWAVPRAMLPDLPQRALATLRSQFVETRSIRQLARDARAILGALLADSEGPRRH